MYDIYTFVLMEFNRDSENLNYSEQWEHEYFIGYPHHFLGTLVLLENVFHAEFKRDRPLSLLSILFLLSGQQQASFSYEELGNEETRLPDRSLLLINTMSCLFLWWLCVWTTQD